MMLALNVRVSQNFILFWQLKEDSTYFPKETEHKISCANLYWIEEGAS